MSVQQALDLYGELLEDQPKLSLSSFSRDVGLPYWQLRDARLNTEREKARQDRQQRYREQVYDVALEHPTYGYRRLHRQLVHLYGQAAPGRHTVRHQLNEQHLTPVQPKKTRRPSPPILAVPLWPEGRRVQIDATRLSLPDGIAWVYVVLDVISRAVLHTEVVRQLSAGSAVTALRQGVEVLRQVGSAEPVVVMSDGGSDFTSLIFGQACQELGCWVRAKVSQPSGMGILERVNRTLKYEWIFREDIGSIAELREQCGRFREWYNRHRMHSALGYTYPWDKLLSSAKSLFAA